MHGLFLLALALHSAGEGSQVEGAAAEATRSLGKVRDDSARGRMGRRMALLCLKSLYTQVARQTF